MLETVQKPIGWLHPYQNNNRKHDSKQIERIAESITEFGFDQPILADVDGVVIAGHGRLLAARKLKLKKVPVIITTLQDVRARARRILDNKLQNDSEWDFDALELELGWLEEQGLDLEHWGLNELMLDKNEPEVEEDDYEQPDEIKTDIKRGDLIELGPHRVLCGDSCDGVDAEKMKGAAFCFTSPPYSDMRDYGGADVSVERICNFIKIDVCDFYAINLGLCRKDGEILPYWNEYIARAQEEGLKFKSWNVWDRSGMGGSIGNMTAMFPIEHEWIFIFGGSKDDVGRTKKNKSAGLHTGISNRQKDGTTERVKPKIVEEFGRIGTVFKSCYASNTGEYNHPAMYPVELPHTYIRACSSEGDGIYDPFLGSGTTLIACEQLNRICYGIEIEPKYCQVILDRYRKYCEDNSKPFECKINGEIVD